MIHRGYLYYATNDEGTVCGKDDTTDSFCRLYRLRLSSPSQSELLYEYKGINANLANLTGYNHLVMFTCSSYSSPSLETFNSALYSYDTSDHTVKMISEDIGNYSINGNKIVYYWVDGLTRCCDMNGDNKEILRNVTGLTYSDTQYIISDTLLVKLRTPAEKRDGSTRRRIIVYDLDGNVLQSFDIDKLGINDIYGGDSIFIFIPNESSESNEYGQIRSLWVIDKRKIAAKTAKPEKLFEFTPTFKFQGVVGKID